jgi:hypothetical protein
LAHEGFGVAAIGAISAGLVPVLSDTAPFRKLLSKTGYGHTIKRGDREGTADRMERFHTEFTRQPRPVRRRLMRVVSEYDWSAVARRYTGLYERCAAARTEAGEQVGLGKQETHNCASSIPDSGLLLPPDVYDRMARNYNGGETFSATVTTIVDAPMGCEPTALPAG